MRLWCALILLMTVGLSLFLDVSERSPEHFYCRFGFCRADQFSDNSSYGAKKLVIATTVSALRLDAANPYRWAECGIALDERGYHAKAGQFFDRATELGANTPPVLMVAANHCLLVNEPDHALEFGRRVLLLTGDFDDLLFATYGQLGRPLHAFLGTGIPIERRAAVAWMNWIIPRAPETDLVEAWRWLRGEGFADDTVTARLMQEVWQRRGCSQAARLWAEWLGAQRDDFPQPELLSNRRFAQTPRPGPFDWTIEPNPAVEVAFGKGLWLSFDGSENLSYYGPRQMAAVSPGVYRLSAIVKSDGLTTNQGVRLHVFDAFTPSRLDAATPAVTGTTQQHVVDAVFEVSAPACGVVVQVERLPSEKFDNKIAGSINIREISLRRLH